MRQARSVDPPATTRAALHAVFGPGVDRVAVFEHSWFARLHLGMAATTRPGRIYLRGGAVEFFADAEFVLHEYFHVLRQWDGRTLTRARYLLESARRGYRANRYEIAAREFASARLPRFVALLTEASRAPPA